MIAGGIGAGDFQFSSCAENERDPMLVKNSSRELMIVIPLSTVCFG